MRTACLVLLAALSLPAGAVATTFEDYPQTGGSIALVGKDSIRTVSVRMGQDCVGTLRLCIPLTADPRTTGASFELFNTAGHGDDVACARPAEGAVVGETDEVPPDALSRQESRGELRAIRRDAVRQGPRAGAPWCGRRERAPCTR